MKEKIIYALGFFDGVHLGHQALLRECCRLAKQQNAQPAAITFSQHPQALFAQTPPLISSIADRQALLTQFGVEKIYVLPVTEEVMSTTWDDFLAHLVQQGAVGFVCGNDFRFGNKGAGTAETLKNYCAENAMPCVIVPEQLAAGIRVSSSHIRKLLEAGCIEEAKMFLGHPHQLTGRVVSGRQLGRTIGIPTANLLLPDGILCPRHGVYACKAIVDSREYPAVTNIGTRPTVSGQGVTVESWLLDFDGDLYGKELTVQFYAFLRPEKKFPDLDILKEEILKNAAQTRKILEKS